MTYRERLSSDTASVGVWGVWGVGHIGYTLVCHLARQGVRVVGVDSDAARVTTINRAEPPILGIEAWLGFVPGEAFASGQAVATTDWRAALTPDVLVHSICVPTERDGAPYLDALKDVCRKIAQAPRPTVDGPGHLPPLVIVESTVTPGTIDDCVVPIFEAAGLVVGRDILVGCAPRRDWFGTTERSLRTLPRVVGGTNALATAALLDVLGIVCDELVAAPDHRHAEVVKSAENAYRQVEITLANQLSRAYPHLDMRRILELVGTKWNVGTYQPGFGIGGYCIPLASRYLLAGAAHPEHLTLLQAATESAADQPRAIAAALAARGDVRTVGILGLSYTHDVKVWSHSPTLALVPALRARGVRVQVHDPYYTDDEIRRLAGAEPFRVPADLGRFDALLVVSGHRLYRSLEATGLPGLLAGCRLILDNAAVWRDVPFGQHGIEYHAAGEAGWLGPGGP